MTKRPLHIDLHACMRGDRKAQFELYHCYKRQFYGLCFRYARNRQDAEDILQEGFYQIFKSLHQYKGKGNFEGWMRKVMVNSALMHIRKHRQNEPVLLGLDQQAQQLYDPDFLQQEADGEVIIHLIQQLPAVYQMIFNLRAIEEYSFKEIAALIELKEPTARSYYLRARKALQKLYSEFIIEG